MNKIMYDIFHWLIFGFILSLLPIVFGIWAHFNNIENQTQGLSSAISILTSHGEVFLVCIPAISFGLGELVKSHKSSDGSGIIALLLFGFSLVLICSCIYIYTQAATTKMDISYLYETSRLFLFSTLFSLMATITYTSHKKAKNDSIY